jgi:DNA-binding FrmR family transcriptional regulator
VSEEKCCCRKKHRDEQELKKLTNRLSRIEGQVRGIRGMVENDAYCVDIITQVMAVQSALNAFNKMLLSQHIKTCVVDDVKNGNDEKVDELLNTLQKLMK